MRTLKALLSALIIVLLFPALIFAQAFGEYGRAVGGVPYGQKITGSRAPGGVHAGGHSVGGVGAVGSRGLPSRLVVAVQDASLFPRQDDEGEKLDQLNQGEILTPIVQSSGGNEWFMVKTQKGVIGWVKSADVREDKIKK